MRTKGLKDAMEAKKLADEAVKEELKALGYTYNTSSHLINLESIHRLENFPVDVSSSST